MILPRCLFLLRIHQIAATVNRRRKVPTSTDASTTGATIFFFLQETEAHRFGFPHTLATKLINNQILTEKQVLTL